MYYFCTMLNRIQTVKIHWSKPILFDNRWNSQNFNEEIGLLFLEDISVMDSSMKSYLCWRDNKYV